MASHQHLGGVAAYGDNSGSGHKRKKKKKKKKKKKQRWPCPRRCRALLNVPLKLP